MRSLALVPVALAACTSSHYDVLVHFGDPELVDDSVRIELSLSRAPCSAQSSTGGSPLDVVRAGSVRRNGPSTEIGDVGPGRYSLYARAFNDTCAVVASGCTNFEIVAGGTDVLEVTVYTVLGPLCPATSSCEEGGYCESDDAAVSDAHFDGGPLDAPLADAPPADALPVDSGCGAPTGCIAGMLHECVGASIAMTPCRLGCMDGAPRCYEIDPLNVHDRAPLDSGADDIEVPAGSTWTADTDTGRIVDDMSREIRPALVGMDSRSGISYAQLAPAAIMGAPLGVFSVRSLHIGLDATLRATGARALVILAADSVIVEGEISVSARGDVAGPGTLARVSGRDGSNGGSARGGGGGGGYGTPGGTGGSGRAAGLGGGGGPTFGDPTLEPLVGGGPGGRGLFGDPGGAGGGALQITAGDLVRIESVGRIDAGGGGGGGGMPASTRGGAGSGGGSGGAIVLEAPTVEVLGLVGACGGGGGSGAERTTGGLAGADGTMKVVPAPGGLRGPVVPAGGDGSDLVGDAEPGEDGMDSGGGGGGGGGRVRIQNLSGALSLGSQVAPRDGATVGRLTLR